MLYNGAGKTGKAAKLMKKALCGLLSFLLLGCGTALAEGGSTILYQGHGSLRITTGEGRVIYIDPYAGEGYDVPGRIILRPGEELVLE